MKPFVSGCVAGFHDEILSIVNSLSDVKIFVDKLIEKLSESGLILGTSHIVASVGSAL